ncbi:hypothetical protein BDR07DRAFT_1376442 [Suillus spraguei]|nr:hypothetical protein BDR07DRAFT_1376442 [Suillus spraguei]
MSSAPSNKFLPSPKTVARRSVKTWRRQRSYPSRPGRVINQVEELGWRVVFDGHHQFEDISPPPDGIQVNATADPAVDTLSLRECCIRRAGSCRDGAPPRHPWRRSFLSHGTISGTLRAYDQACVIWIDAHADINTIYSTDSGNIHGMPLSFLLKLNPPAPSPDSVLAKFDWGEKEILKKHRIKAFSMHEVDRYGIGKVVEMALDHVNPQRDRPIHLSFDVDALDPSVAPSTGHTTLCSPHALCGWVDLWQEFPSTRRADILFPNKLISSQTKCQVRGGLTFREGHYICEAIHETGLLVALDLMEVTPRLQTLRVVRQTVTVGCSLVRSALDYLQRGSSVMLYYLVTVTE